MVPVNHEEPLRCLVEFFNFAWKTWLEIHRQKTPSASCGPPGLKGQWCHAGPQAQGGRGATGDCRSQTEWICKEEKVAGRTQWICWFILRVLFLIFFCLLCLLDMDVIMKATLATECWQKEKQKIKKTKKAPREAKNQENNEPHIFSWGIFFNQNSKKAKTKEHILGGILLFLFFFSRGKNKKETKKKYYLGDSFVW